MIFALLAYLSMAALMLVVLLVFVMLAGGWHETSDKLKFFNGTDYSSLQLQWIIVWSAFAWPIVLYGLLTGIFKSDKVDG